MIGTASLGKRGFETFSVVCDALMELGDYPILADHLYVPLVNIFMLGLLMQGYFCRVPFDNPQATHETSGRVNRYFRVRIPA